MKTQEIIDHFGDVKKAADALGVWPQTIYAWGEYPPLSRQYQVQVMTDGELKAEEINYG
jgi:hypothetical protein